ncbi:hypothetical protein OROHE_002881 [Orobanche hederae]
MEQEKRPRMLRYRYSTASDFSEYPSKKLISALEPSERELNTDYWKNREALIKEIGDYVGEIAAKRARIEVEALLRIHEEKMIAAVGGTLLGGWQRWSVLWLPCPRPWRGQLWSSPRRAWQRPRRVRKMQMVLPFPPSRRPLGKK